MDKKYKLIALCGKSASGKDAILNNVIMTCPSSKVHRKVSYTTRPKRSGEANGIDYNFTEKKFFIENLDNFLEVSKFNDWYYGTLLGGKSLDDTKINIGIFNSEGIRTLKEESGDTLECIVIYVEARDKLRLIRSLQREEDPDVEEVIRRFQTDSMDFYDIDEYADLKVINNEKRNLDYITGYINEIISAWYEGDYGDLL